MASKKEKDWTFIDSKDKRKHKKSKNRRKQRKNEFEIINGVGSSSEEQQFEVIPASKVRTFELEPLSLNEDHFHNKSNGSSTPPSSKEDTDSDIEVIGRDPSLKLYSETLLKSARQQQQESEDRVIDSDYIESAEDVLAMEIDNLVYDDNNTLNNDEDGNNNDYDFGIEVIDEGSAIDVELLKLEKSAFPKEAKLEEETEQNDEKSWEDNVAEEEDLCKQIESNDVEEIETKSSDVKVTPMIDENEETITEKHDVHNKQDMDFDMSASTFGLADLFNDEEEKNDIVSIKTTTLVLLFCVSIAAGMSVGTGIGSLIAWQSSPDVTFDQHRNSLAKSEEPEIIEPIIYEDGEFKVTETAIKDILASFRQLEIKYNNLKSGYADYKRRYNLHKTMMWYWKKRAKSYESKYNDMDGERYVFVFEERVQNVSDVSMLVNLTQELKKEKENTEYWRNKYTALKLSKLRTCAKIGNEVSPIGFSFSNCLLHLSNVMPDISTTFFNLTSPVERISNHVNKAWLSLKTKWKKDAGLKTSATSKKNVNAKRFRKIFSYGNIVVDDNIKHDNHDQDMSDEENRDFDIKSFPKPEDGKKVQEVFSLHPEEHVAKPSKSNSCEREETIHIFMKETSIPCKKHKIDLTKERSTPCDKDCVLPNDQSEQMLRHEVERLQKKLNDTLRLFQAYKVKSKRHLEEATSEMKRRWQENKEERKERMVKLKKQKQELKIRLREINQKQREKCQAHIRDFEDMNDQLQMKIRDLQKEKRYWFRIEKYNLQNKIDELNDSMSALRGKYERKIKILKLKFKKYMKLHKNNKNRKDNKTKKNEEKIQILKLQASRLEKKMDFYKKKDNSCNTKIQNLKARIEKVKAMQVKKATNPRMKKKENKQRKSLEKKEEFWRSVNHDDKFHLPWLPTVYCADQKNCMGDEEKKFDSPEETDHYGYPGPFAVQRFKNDEDVLMINKDIRPPLNLKLSFFQPKPIPPKGYQPQKPTKSYCPISTKTKRPDKPTPPKRLKELEEKLKWFHQNSSTSSDSDEDQQEEQDVQPWYISLADHRAMMREEREALDEIIEKDWYMAMVREREEQREAIKREDEEKQRILNWYVKSMLEKDDKREENWYFKKNKN